MREVTQPRPIWPEVLQVGVIAVVYLGLVVPTAEWHGFWSDEFYTIRTVELPWLRLVTERASAGHPPLFFLLEKLLVGVMASERETAYRALPLLCSLGTMLLTYRLVSREGGRFSGTLACLLLATTASHLLMSQMARSYTLLQLLLTAHGALLITAGRGTIWRLGISTILTGAAFYTHGAAMVAVPCQLLAIAFAMPTSWKFICSAALGCVLYVPFLLAFPATGRVERHLAWISRPSISTVVEFPARLQFGPQLDVTPELLRIVAMILIPWLAIAALSASKAARFWSLQWLFAWATGAAAAVTGLGILSVERYFAPALVGQAIFMSLALHRISLQRRGLAVGIAVALAGVSSASTQMYFCVPAFTPWREMARLVIALSAPEDAVYLGSRRMPADPLKYYYHPNIDFLDQNSTVDLGGPRTIWVCFGEPLKEIDPVQEVAQTVHAEIVSSEEYRLRRGIILRAELLPNPRMESKQIPASSP